MEQQSQPQTKKISNLEKRKPKGQSSTIDVNIDGLLAPVPLKNQGIFICNVSTGGITITIKDASGSSSIAKNRFLIGSDKILQPNEGIMLIYDDVSLRWRSQAIQI